ncbi:MAG: chalcone isomerase family protein [Ramlibacter sp.]
MKSLKQLAAGAMLCLLATGAMAQVNVSGVKYDESVDARGTKLQLNGAGVRYKAVFKVYTAGLYLTRKAGTPDEVLAAAGPKRLNIVMLRDIDSGELGKLFSRGMEDNMDKAAFSKLIPGVLRMSQIFSDHKKLVAGDAFSIDWVPGTGTVITVKGVPQGEPFKEPEFFNALLRIWLGPNPADWKLKDALLGKAA